MNLETLIAKNCSSASVNKLSQEEVNSYIELFPEWEIDEDGMLVTNFEMENFEDAIDLVNQIAALAESEGHHPDILIHNYKYVGIILHTHSAEGLTEKDFILAAKIDAMFGEGA